MDMLEKTKRRMAPRKGSSANYKDRISDTVFREVTINYGSRGDMEIMRSPQGVVEFLRSKAPNNSQEHLMALYLCGSHKPVGFSVVSTGGANSCQVHPREVFQRAIMLGACSLIMAHNHPSGSCEPSPEDISITKQLEQAGKILEVRLLDHIIFTDTEHYSFRDARRI